MRCFLVNVLHIRGNWPSEIAVSAPDAEQAKIDAEASGLYRALDARLWNERIAA
jgi:allantoicase